MKPVTLAIVVTILAVAVAGSLLVLWVADPPMFSSAGNKPKVGPAWQGQFNGCCFDDGVRNADVMPVPTIPTNVSTLYLSGSLSISSWTHFNGTGNDTGTCNPPTGPADACDAYVGVWTPNAWDAYAAGGPLDPYWCYPGNGSACVAFHNATFTSSNLTSLEGQPFEIVIWNTPDYGLIGAYSLTLFATPNTWSS